MAEGVEVGQWPKVKIVMGKANETRILINDEEVLGCVYIALEQGANDPLATLTLHLLSDDISIEGEGIVKVERAYQRERAHGLQFTSDGGDGESRRLAPGEG